MKRIFVLIIFLQGIIITSMYKGAIPKIRPFVKSDRYQIPTVGFLKPTSIALSPKTNLNQASKDHVNLWKCWMATQLLKKGPRAYIFMESNLRNLDRGLLDISEQLYPFVYRPENIEKFLEYQAENKKQKELEDIEVFFRSEIANMISTIFVNLEEKHPVLFKRLIFEIISNQSNVFTKIFTKKYNQEIIKDFVIKLFEVFGEDSIAFKAYLVYQDMKSVVKKSISDIQENSMDQDVAVDPLEELRKVLKDEIVTNGVGLILKLQNRYPSLFTDLLNRIKNMSIAEKYDFFISVIAEVQELEKRPLNGSKKVAINILLHRTPEQIELFEGFEKDINRLKMFVGAALFLALSGITFGIVHEIYSLARG